MTENEAKRPKIAVIGGGRNAGRTLKAHIDLLEELEQYRAIGTVEELQNMKDHLLMVKGMCKDYYEIGTIEDFKALKEKSVGKKIVYVSNMWIKTPHCPNCDMELTMNMYQRKFCDCGQKLDWQ